MTDLIVIKRLPEIEEHLQSVKEEVTTKVNTALSLVVTEDTVKSVKAVRAELNKELKDFEESRKSVKREVLKPYEQFEAVYKDCISDTYKHADVELKKKIDDVENTLKDEKKAEVKAYFDEYLQSANIDFVTFENANINVTLSASMKSLKEQAKAFIDRIVGDLSLIDTQTYKDEIMYEYKQTLNVSSAITKVVNRYKEIEIAKAREEERKAQEQAKKEAAAKVEQVVETLTPPTVEPIAPPVAPMIVEKFSFVVTASENKISRLISFLESEEYDYERI